MSKGTVMKSVYVGVAATVLQAICLVAFILISRTDVAAVGKPIVIGATFLGVVLLLWWGIRAAQTPAALAMLPVLFSLGYVVAFHMVGLLAFPGLLRDWGLSSDYLLSVLRVAAITFALYAVATALLYGLGKALRARTPAT